MTAQTIAQGLPTRAQVPEELKWDLTTVYASDGEWEADFRLLEAALPELESFKGKLGHDGRTLMQALSCRDKYEQIVWKLRAYASMRHDEDTANGKYQGLYERARTLVNRYSAAVSYITPEILSIETQQLEQFLATTVGLELYRFELSDLIRRKAHVRSAEVEAILAQSNELRTTPRAVYGQLTNADMAYPPVVDANGERIELTDGNYVSRFLMSPERVERQRGFETMMSSYASVRNALGSLYAAQVRGNIFNARARHYGTSLQAALDASNIPTNVYTNLLDTVHGNIGKLNRYLNLRKRLLKLDELHMYDLYVPIVAEVEYKVTYPEAQEIVLEALAPLGNDYVSALENGFSGRWIDVLENKGKRSGAYSGGSYGTNPFILLNWQDCLDSMFTLAHESGHSMHSYFTRRTQPYPYGSYTIFVAEVASTCNEALLRHHLLQTITDKAVRQLVVNDALEAFRTTLFRQALFAEFEKEAHELAESGQALTADSLAVLFKGLNDKYYGGVCVVDDLIANEWSRIPHFYSSFYVYQYCTGISAGIALAQQIISEGPSAVKRYLAFLSSGSSGYSIDLLRNAGVDLSTPQPIQQALDTFDSYLDELEKALA